MTFRQVLQSHSPGAGNSWLARGPVRMWRKEALEALAQGPGTVAQLCTSLGVNQSSDIGLRRALLWFVDSGLATSAKVPLRGRGAHAVAVYTITERGLGRAGG